MKISSVEQFLVLKKNIWAWQSMEHDHLNKLSITFQQKDQCEIWWKLAKWFLKNHDLTGLPLSGRTAYITPWDCHRTSKLNFKDVPRTSEISFVRPKSIPETSKNCQKARPLLASCMMFAPPTYRKFATCVDWALRTSHFPLAGVLLTAVSSVAAPFWWLRDHCVYLSRVLSWLIDVFIIKFSTATPKIFVEIIWSHYYFLIFTS